MVDNKEKIIEEFENELSELRSKNKSLWETYGSELCAGEMLRKEKELEDKILKLKTH